MILVLPWPTAVTVTVLFDITTVATWSSPDSAEYVEGITIAISEDSGEVFCIGVGDIHPLIPQQLFHPRCIVGQDGDGKCGFDRVVTSLFVSGPNDEGRCSGLVAGHDQRVVIDQPRNYIRGRTPESMPKCITIRIAEDRGQVYTEFATAANGLIRDLANDRRDLVACDGHGKVVFGPFPYYLVHRWP